MRYVICSLLIGWSCHAESIAQPELLGFVDLDGRIVLHPVGGTVDTAGLDLASHSGSLIPIPPGDLTAPANPFTFLLFNGPRQITYGKLGSAVEISEPLTLSAGFDLSAADPCEDLRVAITSSLSGLCTLPGDLDFDGKVQFGDFLRFADNFASTKADWTMGDFDWDRKVGLADFVMLRANYGKSLSAVAAPVPEPSTSPMLVAALAGLLPLYRLRRRRR